MNNCKFCGKDITEKNQRKFCSIKCSNLFFNKRDRKKYRKDYWEKNKETLKIKHREYWKNYADKNKEKIQKKSREYNQKNKEKHLEYYRKNIIRISQRNKKYYLKNKKRLDEKNRKNNKKLYIFNLLSWKGYIPEKTNCQICNKEIYFCGNKKIDAIHFDHRNGGTETIKGTPSTWLGRHKMTEENKKIWISCNFGFLCSSCNSFLPTKNRKEFIKKVNQYLNKK